MRHLDPEVNFGRNKRQRQIITAILDTASISSVTRFDDLLGVLSDNVKTNIMDIQKNYSDCRQNIS